MANRWGKGKTVADFIFLCSKIPMEVDWSYEIKRHFSRLLVQDGRVEGHALISSCKSIKIATSYWTTIYRRFFRGHQGTHQKKIPHVQRQWRNHSEMVGGAQSQWNQIPYPSGGWPTNWRTIIPKNFLHCFESSEPHIRLPSLVIWQRYWESPGNLALRASGIWL